MKKDAVFLYVFRHDGREQFQLFYRDPPPKEQLAALGTVVWRNRLNAPQRTMKLSEVTRWFLLAREYGELPADNMTPPAKKRDDRGVLLELETRESPVDFARRIRRAAGIADPSDSPAAT